MSMAWAGFLSGLGQGAQKASDNYTIEKRLAQQLAHQKAQEDQAQKNFEVQMRKVDEATKRGDEQTQRANNLQDRQTINEDLTNMSTDQMPLASMPLAWQANAMKYAPTQVGYQPPSMGKSTESAEVGPSEGGQMVNRFVTPGERNNQRSMESALARSNTANDIKTAQIEMMRQRYSDETNGLGYAKLDAAQRARDAADARRQQLKDDKDEKDKAKAHEAAGRWAFSTAAGAYNNWAREYVKTPDGMNGISPELRKAKLGSLFTEALTPLGKSPADYPEAAKQLGINLDPEAIDTSIGAAPTPQAPPPAKKPFFDLSRIFGDSTQRPPSPAMLTNGPSGAPQPPPQAPQPVVPEPPPPAPPSPQRALPAPAAPMQPPPGAAHPAAITVPEGGFTSGVKVTNPPVPAGGFNKPAPDWQGPKKVSINELRNLLPQLAPHGIKSDMDLLNYARSEGYTVTG